MSTLCVQLFGGLKIEPLSTKTQLSPKVEEVFCYLILYRHSAHSRETLCDLFWRDQEEASARRSLNTALWRLRSVVNSGELNLTEPYILTKHGGNVQFNCASDFILDVEKFESILRPLTTKSAVLTTLPMCSHEADRLLGALELYRGDVLANDHCDWALIERERLRNLYMLGISRIINYFKRAAAYDQAIYWADRMLQIEPLREDAHREIMQLYIAAGNSGLALRQYELCRNLLKKELGVRPDPETQRLRCSLSAA